MPHRDIRDWVDRGKHVRVPGADKGDMVFLRLAAPSSRARVKLSGARVGAQCG